MLWQGLRGLEGAKWCVLRKYTVYITLKHSCKLAQALQAGCQYAVERHILPLLSLRLVILFVDRKSARVTIASSTPAVAQSIANSLNDLHEEAVGCGTTCHEKSASFQAYTIMGLPVIACPHSLLLRSVPLLLVSCLLQAQRPPVSLWPASVGRRMSPPRLAWFLHPSLKSICTDKFAPHHADTIDLISYSALKFLVFSILASPSSQYNNTPTTFGTPCRGV